MKWKVTYSGKAKEIMDERKIHDEVREAKLGERFNELSNQLLLLSRGKI